jgi:putative NIF3 family GTP cyclohydrolase 1 type 2
VAGMIGSPRRLHTDITVQISVYCVHHPLTVYSRYLLHYYRYAILHPRTTCPQVGTRISLANTLANRPGEMNQP